MYRKKVLLNLLRSARVSKQYIDAVKYFRCVECEENAPRRTGHKTSLPNRYEFNYALGIDVLEILDADGAKYQVLNMICLGTCFQLAEVVRSGPGQPTSARCLEAIKKRLISWAGNPSTMQYDRGLHNRAVMSAQGIQVYRAPLETPRPLDVLNAMAVYSKVWQGRSYFRPKQGERHRFNPYWMNHA